MNIFEYSKFLTNAKDYNEAKSLMNSITNVIVSGLNKPTLYTNNDLYKDCAKALKASDPHMANLYKSGYSLGCIADMIEGLASPYNM